MGALEARPTEEAIADEAGAVRRHERDNTARESKDEVRDKNPGKAERPGSPEACRL